MNRQVTIRSAAQAATCARGARDWYDQARETGLEANSRWPLRMPVLALEQSPERQAFYYRDFRRVPTDRFPYKIF